MSEKVKDLHFLTFRREFVFIHLLFFIAVKAGGSNPVKKLVKKLWKPSKPKQAGKSFVLLGIAWLLAAFINRQLTGAPLEFQKFQYPNEDTMRKDYGDRSHARTAESNRFIDQLVYV